MEANSTNWEEIIEKYQNLIAEDPHNAEFHKELGNAFHRTSQYELALEEYRTALHIDPEYYPAQYNMGNTHWKLGDYYQAIICWQKALIMKPELEHAIYNVAFAYYRLGTVETDREKSRRHFDNAVLEFQKAIRIKADSTDTHLHLGLTWFELERFEEAILEYQKVLELDANDRYAHYNLGNVYYELGAADPKYYEMALAEYRQSILKNPDDLKSLNNIADCLLRLGKDLEALEQIDGVLAQNPNYIPARCTRGEIFTALGRREEAVREFRLVLQLDPEEHRVLHRYVARQLLELYETMLDQDGTSAQLYQRLARTCLDIGMVYGDRGYIVKARDLLRTAISKLGSRGDLHLLLGESYMMLTHYDYALMEAERCLNIDAASVPAHCLLSEIYLHTGERELAVKEIQSVRKLLALERDRELDQAAPREATPAKPRRRGEGRTTDGPVH